MSRSNYGKMPEGWSWHKARDELRLKSSAFSVPVYVFRTCFSAALWCITLCIVVKPSFCYNQFKQLFAKLNIFRGVFALDEIHTIVWSTFSLVEQPPPPPLLPPSPFNDGLVQFGLVSTKLRSGPPPFSYNPFSSSPFPLEKNAWSQVAPPPPLPPHKKSWLRAWNAVNLVKSIFSQVDRKCQFQEGERPAQQVTMMRAQHYAH